jgi:hypothetical protein
MDSLEIVPSTLHSGVDLELSLGHTHYYRNMNSNNTSQTSHNFSDSCINTTNGMTGPVPSVWLRLSRVIYSIFDWSKTKNELPHPANGNDNNV